MHVYNSLQFGVYTLVAAIAILVVTAQKAVAVVAVLDILIFSSTCPLSTYSSPSSHHARRSVARRQTTALRCHRSQLCQRRRTPRPLSPLLILTSTQRRKFHAVLISLPTAPSASYESKSFFGTLVHKFFAEFEDLQDAAIDALLDLCEDEDEKVRTIGIRALGPTARADPRWVRGNTGVLLQLLASRAFASLWAAKLLTTLLA